MNGPIAIDCRMWGHPGIGRYLRELCARLVPLLEERPCRLIGHPGDQARILERLARTKHVSFAAVRSPIYSLSEHLEVARAARGASLLHVPHFNAPLGWRGRLVTTVHDLIYVHDSTPARRLYARAFLASACRRSRAVIAVSEATRRDLLSVFPKTDAARVHVVPEAASEAFTATRDPGEVERVRRRHGLGRPYVLFVGSLKPHKNVPMLVEAVRRLRETGRIAHELVVVGRRDPKYRSWPALAQSSPFVRELGVLDDRELKSLYQVADVLVLPSTREGFGLPVLEAMACGTPVLCSDTSSLPEVGGEAARYFDPRQIDALTGLLYTVLEDTVLREKMSRMGIERAGTFSWDLAARRTLEVYRQALR